MAHKAKRGSSLYWKLIRAYAAANDAARVAMKSGDFGKSMALRNLAGRIFRIGRDRYGRSRHPNQLRLDREAAEMATEKYGD